MKRRDFLMGVAGAAGVVTTAGAQIVRPEIAIPKQRNVILFVYDGFSWEDFAVARQYAQRFEGRTLALERLLSLGVTGSLLTHSLTSPVTDSAAAATAWATGRRTANANIGVYPDGRPLKTILELAKDRGLATGLITTTRITHATPAGFAAHIVNRNRENRIAEQYLELQPDLLLGGGRRHFHADLRGDGRDLFAEYAAEGYSIVRTLDELGHVKREKVLGTFADSHLPFEIDRVNQGVEGPSLAEITDHGLNLLSKAPRGFIAQVEAGRIDHGNHNNDPAAMLWEVLAADKALETVLHFADQNPETLLVAASDHGTGGAALFGIGSNYHQVSAAFEKIRLRRASYDFVLRQLGPAPGITDVIAAGEEFLGTRLPENTARWVVSALEGRPEIAHTAAYHQQPQNSLGWALAASERYNDPDRLNIQYSAGQHTAGPVPVCLYGGENSQAQLGLVDMVALYDWMSQAIGVDYQNPVMSEAEALEVLEELAAG